MRMGRALHYSMKCSGQHGSTPLLQRQGRGGIPTRASIMRENCLDSDANTHSWFCVVGPQETELPLRLKKSRSCSALSDLGDRPEDASIAAVTPPNPSPLRDSVPRPHLGWD